MAASPTFPVTWVSQTFTTGTSNTFAEIDKVVLNPDNAFEAALINMVRTYRRKNHDYAQHDNWSSNFEDVANQMGFEHPVLAADALIAVKQARLRSLAYNGVDPENEGVIDTYEDRAVYAVIALALLKDERFFTPQDGGYDDDGE